MYVRRNRFLIDIPFRAVESDCSVRTEVKESPFVEENNVGENKNRTQELVGLVADDNYFCRMHLQTYFRHKGLRVLLARDGKEVIRLVHTITPHWFP
jgi:hypothetical protein